MFPQLGLKMIANLRPQSKISHKYPEKKGLKVKHSKGISITRDCQNSLLFIALFLKLYWTFKKEGEFPLDYPLNFNGLTKALGIEDPCEGFIFQFTKIFEYIFTTNYIPTR